MGYALAKEKPLLEANFLPRPKSARERAVNRWFNRENAPLSTTTVSDKTVPGQYFDQESNLFYNHFRYYDPILGRYITSDPIGLDAGNNTYVYTGDNPVNRIDPYGQYWQILTKLKRIWDGCKWGLKKIKDWIWKKDKDKPDAPSAPKPDADRIRRCNDAWLSCFRASVHNSSITEAACFASHSVCTTTTLPVIFPDGTVVK